MGDNLCLWHEEIQAGNGPIYVGTSSSIDFSQELNGLRDWSEQQTLALEMAITKANEELLELRALVMSFFAKRGEASAPETSARFPPPSGEEIDDIPLNIKPENIAGSDDAIAKGGGWQ